MASVVSDKSPSPSPLPLLSTSSSYSSTSPNAAVSTPSFVHNQLETVCDCCGKNFVMDLESFSDCINVMELFAQNPEENAGGKAPIFFPYSGELEEMIKDISFGTNINAPRIAPSNFRMTTFFETVRTNLGLPFPMCAQCLLKETSYLEMELDDKLADKASYKKFLSQMTQEQQSDITEMEKEINLARKSSNVTTKNRRR